MAQRTGHDYRNLKVSGRGRLHAGDNHYHYAAVSEDDDAKRTLTGILDWLDAPDTISDHRAARNRRAPGTGDWFLRSDQYADWRSGKQPRLWLHGKAGCCKTVLCSTIVEDITNTRRADAKIAYFYFSFADSTRQSWDSLLRALISQLVIDTFPINEALLEAYRKRQRHSDDLERVLVSILTTQPPAFVCLDALDECPLDNDSRPELLAGLDKIGAKVPELRLLMTSRNEADLKDFISQYASVSVAIREAAVNSDIEVYVSGELLKDKTLRTLPEDTKELISRTLTAKADGMFRYVYCQIHEIKRLIFPRPNNIAEILQSLPRSLDATYDRLLCNYDDQFGDLRSILQWLVFSRTRLSVAELVEATITSYNPPSFDKSSRNAVMRGILDVLAPLVVTYDGATRDASHNLVRVAHFSVQEYLVSDRILRGSASVFHLNATIAHHHIGQTCIAHMLCHRGTAPNIYRSTALGFYSTWHWFVHESAVQHAKDPNFELGLQPSFLLDLISNQADINRGYTMTFSDYMNSLTDMPMRAYDDFLNESGTGVRDHCALALAADFSLPLTVAYFVSKIVDINASVAGWAPPLHIAATVGDSQTIEMLLAKGADASVCYEGYDALAWAVIASRRDAVTALLQTAVSSNCSPSADRAMALAIERQNWKILRHLIAEGVDPNMNNTSDTTYLQAAALSGDLDAVEMLLGAGADVNAPPGRYGTALQVAVRCNHGPDPVAVVKLILNAGANVDVLGMPYVTEDWRLARVLRTHAVKAVYYRWEHRHLGKAPSNHWLRLTDSQGCALPGTECRPV